GGGGAGGVGSGGVGRRVGEGGGGQAGEARLEEVAPAGEDQAFPVARVEVGESVSMIVAGGTAVAHAASSIAGEHGQAGGGGAGVLTFHYTLLGGRLPSESAPGGGSDRRGFDFALCNSLRSL